MGTIQLVTWNSDTDTEVKMDFKFSKDTGDSPKQAVAGDKGRQSVQLVVLLVLVAGFAYIYFFTGLIRPQEGPTPVETPPPQVMKKPPPPREGEAAKAAPAAAPEGKKEAQAPAPVPAKPEPTKPAQAAPAASPAPATAAAKVAAKPGEGAAKPAQPKPAEKKAQPAAPVKQPQKQAVAKAEEKKPAAAGKQQPAGAQKKAAAAPAEKQATAAKRPAPKPGKKPAPRPAEAAGGRWTVTVGAYLLEDALAADMVRVRKAGLDAAVQPGAKRKASMNRLLLAAYDDRGVARAELDKLKRYTSDAFIIEHNGTFSVYAGSYLLDARAQSEKERLAAAGFTLTLKRTEVPIPSKLLTAGTFDDRKSAEAVLRKLKAAGIKASLSRQ